MKKPNIALQRQVWRYRKMGVPNNILARLFDTSYSTANVYVAAGKRLGIIGTVPSGTPSFSHFLSLYFQAEQGGTLTRTDEKLLELIAGEITRLVDFPREWFGEILRAQLVIESQKLAGYRRLWQEIGKRFNPDISSVLKEEVGEFLEEISLTQGTIDWTLEEFSRGLRHRVNCKLKAGKWTYVDDLTKQESIDEAIETLAPVEREVIRFKFGLNDTPTLTLEQIGKKIGQVNRQRVKQIELEALEKLRRTDQIWQLGQPLTLEYYREKIRSLERDLEGCRRFQKEMAEVLLPLPAIQQVIEEKVRLATHPEDLEKLSIRQQLDRPLSTLPVSKRVSGFFENPGLGLLTIRDLVLKPKNQLKGPNFGKGSLGEITELLVKMGLHLGMTEQELS